MSLLSFLLLLLLSLLLLLLGLAEEIVTVESDEVVVDTNYLEGVYSRGGVLKLPALISLLTLLVFLLVSLLTPLSIILLVIIIYGPRVAVRRPI